MRENLRPSPSPGESGSTLLEAVVALAIISILGIGAWSGVGAAIRVADRIRGTAAENAHILELDDVLRELASRVRAPFWAPRQPLTIGAQGARVTCLDGDPGKGFALSFQDGVLEVDDGEATLRFSDFSRVAFSTAADEVGTYGLTLDLTTLDGRTMAMTVRFGGVPIQGIGTP